MGLLQNSHFTTGPFKPPLPKGGASACRGGGIPQAKPGNFLPITYSLFTKKLSLFHIGWYFEEVPTVNPSVTAYAVPAPFGKGAFLPSVSLPSGKGSENSCTVHTLTAAARRNTSLREGGGLGRSPKTEGASGQETNLTTGGGTSPGLKFSHAPSQESAGFNRHRVSAVMSRCQPISKPSAYSPLAPSVTAKATGGSPAVPAPSRRELWGLYLATLVCCSGGSASCESLSRLRRQLPLAREPLGCGIDTGRVREVTIS